MHLIEIQHNLLPNVAAMSKVMVINLTLMGLFHFLIIFLPCTCQYFAMRMGGSGF